jgi:hypothetical protein
MGLAQRLLGAQIPIEGDDLDPERRNVVDEPEVTGHHESARLSGLIGSLSVHGRVLSIHLLVHAFSK